MLLSDVPAPPSGLDAERIRSAAKDVLADAVAHLRRLGLDRLAIRALLAELLLAQGGHRER